MKMASASDSSRLVCAVVPPWTSASDSSSRCPAVANLLGAKSEPLGASDVQRKTPRSIGPIMQAGLKTAARGPKMARKPIFAKITVFEDFFGPWKPKRRAKMGRSAPHRGRRWSAPGPCLDLPLEDFEEFERSLTLVCSTPCTPSF